MAKTEKRARRFQPGEAVWIQLRPWDRYVSRFYLTVIRDPGSARVHLHDSTGRIWRVPRDLICGRVTTPQQRGAMKRQQQQLRMLTTVLQHAMEISARNWEHGDEEENEVCDPGR
jgi:hypothetical protein